MFSKTILIGTACGALALGLIGGYCMSEWRDGYEGRTTRGWGPMGGMMWGGERYERNEGRVGIEGSPVGYSQNIDAHFIEQMIPHHQGAIEMAELALEKTTRPELIALSNAIIASQQKEIDDMTRWYTEWFGKAPVTSTPFGYGRGSGMMGWGGGMMGGDYMSDIEYLKNAFDFDIEFLRAMIPHHEMAIMMANMLRYSTERPEMKALAENIITTQQEEIDDMAEWLRSW